VLNLGRLEHLAAALGMTEPELRTLLDDFDENPGSLVRELTIWPRDPNKKPRDVISLRRPWRVVQQRIYAKLLLPNLKPTRFSHGGVKKRNAATNARAHIGNKFALVTDISNFFPSIKCGSVGRVFREQACEY
jgi:hypothetical protein